MNAEMNNTQEPEMEMFRKMYKDRFGFNPEILEILVADKEKVRAVVLHRNGQITEKCTFTAWRGGHIGRVKA